MKFWKILRNLIIIAVIAALIAPLGYKEYQRLVKVKENQDRANAFVPREVSPYQENPEEELYYYKSIGGEQYFPDNWYGVPGRSEDGPSCILLDDVDVTAQTRYDSFVKTVIFPEEFMQQLSVGEHWVHILDEEGTMYCGYTLNVLEECSFNVPAIHACLYIHDRQLIYSMQDNNDISFYLNNVGDNPIVDVVRFKTNAFGEEYYPSEYLAPDDYTISPAGNKVTISGDYLSTYKIHDRLTLGFRLADGTLVTPDEHHIWILEDAWDGFVLTDMKGTYSLSSGEDFVVHYELRNSSTFYGFNLVNISDQHTVYIQHGDQVLLNDAAGKEQEYADLEAQSITISAERMATLPEGQYMLETTHWFSEPAFGEENLWSYRLYFFEVIP